MGLVRRHLTYANVLSTICLFVVLGGGAYAATRLPAKSVGTAQLKAKAVTNAKIKDGTIKGAKIDASSLGMVPNAQSAQNAGRASSAATADQATSAAKADLATKANLAVNSELLGGVSAAGFVASNQVGFIDRTYSGCTLSVQCQENVLTIGSVTFRATCEYNGGIGAIILRVIGASSTGYGFVNNNNEGRRAQFLGDGNVVMGTSTGTEVGSTGQIVARTPARIITLNFNASSAIPTAGNASCVLYGTALAV